MPTIQSIFLGSCPRLVDSFDLTVDVPQTKFGTVANEYMIDISSPIPAFTVTRGIWNVKFTRTRKAWNGPLPTTALGDQSFLCAITGSPDGGSGNLQTGPFYGGDIGGGSTFAPVSWPCSSDTDYLFAELSPLGVGSLYNYDPFPGSGSSKPPAGIDCSSSFLMDMGCAQCQDPAPVVLHVVAYTIGVSPPGFAFLNNNFGAYPFSVRAQGTRIG